jgi:hypothetical protein
MTLSVVSNQICWSLKLVTRSISVLSLIFVMIQKPASSFPTGLIARLHPPPPGVDYAENPTIFGKKLRGEMAADILEDSPTLLAFRDIHPRAPLHALIIPKQFVPSVFDLNNAALLLDLQDMAHKSWCNNISLKPIPTKITSCAFMFHPLTVSITCICTSWLRRHPCRQWPHLKIE